MDTSISVGIGTLFGGAVLAILSGSAWVVLVQRQRRRNLASALVGEIAAVLRSIELRDLLATLDHPDSSEAPQSCPIAGVVPDHFVVYEQNASKLDRFAAPLPRKIAYFFDRLAGLGHEFDALSRRSSSASLDHQQQKRLLCDDLREVLSLGDDILITLRPTISTHRSRARQLNVPTTKRVTLDDVIRRLWQAGVRRRST